jgi:hypothetical protein
LRECDERPDCGRVRPDHRITIVGNNNASTFTSSAQFIKSEVPLRPTVVGLKVAAHF